MQTPPPHRWLHRDHSGRREPAERPFPSLTAAEPIRPATVTHCTEWPANTASQSLLWPNSTPSRRVRTSTRARCCPCRRRMTCPTPIPPTSWHRVRHWPGLRPGIRCRPDRCAEPTPWATSPFSRLANCSCSGIRRPAGTAPLPNLRRMSPASPRVLRSKASDPLCSRPHDSTSSPCCAGPTRLRPRLVSSWHPSPRNSVPIRLSCRPSRRRSRDSSTPRSRQAMPSASCRSPRRSGRWASDIVGRSLDLLDVADNIVAGTVILGWLIETAESENDALAGYYQDLRSVRSEGLLPETKAFVRAVQMQRQRMQEAL